MSSAYKNKITFNKYEIESLDSLREKRECIQLIVGIATDILELMEKSMSVLSGVKTLQNKRASTLKEETVYTEEEARLFLKIQPGELQSLIDSGRLKSLEISPGKYRILGKSILSFFHDPEEDLSINPAVIIEEE